MLKEPVFIVGHSRSGTTLLQRCLERSDDLWVLGREGKPIWESFFHPILHGRPSNALDESDATPATIARLHELFLEASVRPTLAWDPPAILAFLKWVRSHGVNPFYYGQDLDMVREHFSEDEPYGPPSNLECDAVAELPPFTLPPLGGKRPTEEQKRKGIRLLEKSVQNPFRIAFLRKVFPDARFIIVVRDGREAVSSNIEAWRDPHSYFSYKVPNELRIQGYSDKYPWGRHWWNLNLPPNWQDLIELPLEEVCAHAWVRATEAMLNHYPSLARSGEAVIVSYQELMDDPGNTLTRICRFIDIPPTEKTVSPIFPPVPGGTKPRKNKWRHINPKEIERILPLIASTQEKLGYLGTTEAATYV